MADLFEGFRWKEVAAILGIVTFFVGILITSRQADRIEIEEIEARLRKMETGMVAVQCQVSPETCRMLER